MDRRITGLFLIIGIAVVGYLIYSKVNNNEKMKKISEFNEIIMNASEEYIQKNSEYYPEFIEIGDRVEITVQQLIEDNVLKSGIENPTDKDFNNIIVRLTIESDKTIKYEVLD